jgi:dCMP deaminase
MLVWKPMLMKTSWDLFYIKLAQLWADKSKDRSTGVGAVIVGPDMEQRSAGYNGFPRHVDDSIDCRHDRPLKYEYTEHAERNAIYNAARMGTPLKGCIMYLNWWPWPCPDCARGIIQTGITEVIGPARPFVSGTNSSLTTIIDGKDPTGQSKDWKKSFETTRQMFGEADINIRVITEWKNNGNSG